MKEGCQDMARKKQNYWERRQKEDINKKAIIWVIASFAAIVFIMTILLILDA